MVSAPFREWVRETRDDATYWFFGGNFEDIIVFVAKSTVHWTSEEQFHQPRIICCIGNDETVNCPCTNSIFAHQIRRDRPVTRTSYMPFRLVFSFILCRVRCANERHRNRPKIHKIIFVSRFVFQNALTTDRLGRRYKNHFSNFALSSCLSSITISITWALPLKQFHIYSNYRFELLSHSNPMISSQSPGNRWKKNNVNGPTAGDNKCNYSISKWNRARAHAIFVVWMFVCFVRAERFSRPYRITAEISLSRKLCICGFENVYIYRFIVSRTTRELTSLTLVERLWRWRWRRRRHYRV